MRLAAYSTPSMAALVRHPLQAVRRTNIINLAESKQYMRIALEKVIRRPSQAQSCHSQIAMWLAESAMRSSYCQFIRHSHAFHE